MEACVSERIVSFHANRVIHASIVFPALLHIYKTQFLTKF